jgi:hypothetical protein
MERFIPSYECTFLIYGNPHSGKTRVVHELINILGRDLNYVITTSREDYEGYIINKDYNIEELDVYMDIPISKVLIFDDFLHLCTENGAIRRHLLGIISTTRHDDKKTNVILSTHVLSMGKYIRTCTTVFILFKIDADSEKIIKQNLSIDKQTTDTIKKLLIENKHTFLILNTQGEWELMQLDI